MITYQERLSLVVRSAYSTSLLLTLAGASLALAQETNAPVTTKPIVVTGSLIPTFETITAAPVDVYTAATIEKAGVSDIQQLVKIFPAISGNASFGDSRGNGGDGSAAVGLRNIPGGTLVLINGRRIAPNQLVGSGNVDINAIPLAAIERIEVLKDGASALYGADAVAGVVNIIFKKNFSGTEMNARYGNTTDTDVGEQTYSFVTGTTTDKASLLIGASYYQNNALFSDDRKVSRVDIHNANDFAFGTSGTGNPGRIGQGTLGSAGQGVFYDGLPGTTPTSPLQYRDFNSATDRFVFSHFTPSYVPTQKWYIFGNGNHKLLDSDALEFFAETSYSRTERQNQFAPSPLVTAGGLSSAPGDFTIPASNPYNVFGVPIDTWRYRPVELGPRTEVNTADVFRFVGGFRGKIPDSTVEWEGATLYSEDDRFHRFGHDVNAGALLQAINSTNPATAFNPFGNQANTPAVLQAIDLTIFDRAFSTLASWDGLVRADLFDLPAGPVKGALGGGMRQEKADYQPDSAYQAGTYTGNSQQPFKGSRQINSVFAEVSIPVTSKDNSVPLLHNFEISAAGRYDDYSDIGDTANPKVGFRWQPFENEMVTFRGSYGTSFQSPTIAQTEINFLNFPQVAIPATAPNGYVYGNGGDVDQLQLGSRVLGTSKLKPQTSDNYTIGVVLTPPQVKGLMVSVDYYKLAIKDVIFNDPQFILNHFSPGDIDPATGNPFITVDPATQNLISEEVPYLNLAAINTEGLDFGASYAYQTESLGTFTLSLDANYVLTWERQASPGAPFERLLGRFTDDSAEFGAIPRLKGSVGLLWDYKGFAFNTTARYVGDYRDDVTGDRVGDYWAIDLQLSYNWRKYGAKFTVGVNDVNDESPPKAYAGFADFYARDLYDIRQRFWYVSVTKTF